MATKIGQFAQDLARTNTWWRPGKWEERDPDLTPVLERGLGYASTALDKLVPGNLYIVRGPRRAGKTVLVKQRISRLIQGGTPPRSIIWVAADGWEERDVRNLPRTPGLPRLPNGTRRWWFIDEVTSVEGNWIAQLKWLRDNDPDFGRDTVVLTGSNAPSLTRAVGQFPGRRGRNVDVARTVLPVGFRTFVALTEPDVPVVDQLPLAGLRSRSAADAYDELLPWLDTLVRAWEAYLEYGGFPVAVDAAKRGDPVPVDFANDLFDVVFHDALAESNLSETKTGALVARVMEGIGSPISYSSIASDLGIGTNTVIRHVSWLQDSFLAWACPRRQDDGWLAMENAQEKIYPVDPLLARLMHVRQPQFPDVDLTFRAETQLGLAVRRRQISAGSSWSGEHRLFYWRTPTRKEIDFVSDDLNGTALEGKYTEGAWRREAATVEASQWRGILATRNVLDMTGPDRAWAVPACLLAYVLDT